MKTIKQLFESSNNNYKLDLSMIKSLQRWINKELLTLIKNFTTKDYFDQYRLLLYDSTDKVKRYNEKIIEILKKYEKH